MTALVRANPADQHRTNKINRRYFTVRILKLQSYIKLFNKDFTKIISSIGYTSVKYSYDQIIVIYSWILYLSFPVRSSMYSAAFCLPSLLSCWYMSTSHSSSAESMGYTDIVSLHRLTGISSTTYRSGRTSRKMRCQPYNNVCSKHCCMADTKKLHLLISIRMLYEVIIRLASYSIFCYCYWYIFSQSLLPWWQQSLSTIAAGSIPAAIKSEFRLNH